MQNASAKDLISDFPADAEVFADELVGGEQPMLFKPS